MKHLSEEQMFALVDGGVPPNRQDGLRAHLVECAACTRDYEDIRQLITDVANAPELDETAHVQGVMAAIHRRLETRAPLDAKASRRAPRAPRVRRVVPAVVIAVVTVAAAAALLVRLTPRDPMGGEVAARGSGRAPSLRRNVGIRVFTNDRGLTPIAEHAVIDRAAVFTAAYTSLQTHPVRALVFAVDATGSVHWLYPAHTRVDEDPESVVLDPSRQERALPTSVVLEDPALGPMRIVSIVTEAPLHVSDIEGRSPEELSRAALQRRFDGVIAEVHIEIRGPSLPLPTNTQGPR